MIALELQDVSMSFGRLNAVADLSLRVEEGSIHGLIGPNGAGKTTAFNLITGFHRPTRGRVLLYGEDITGLPAHLVAKKGMTRSFQQNLIFMNETVLDNVLTGFHMSHALGKLNVFLHTARARRAERDMVDGAVEILSFMEIETLRNELAGNLAHGHQKALGVSMALACAPRVLLLDEPVTGMNSTETKHMMDRIVAMRNQGITVVLVEHSMQVVMNICDPITVMDYGRAIAQGSSECIQSDEGVIEAYLGCEEA